MNYVPITCRCFLMIATWMTKYGMILAQLYSYFVSLKGFSTTLTQQWMGKSETIPLGCNFKLHFSKKNSRFEFFPQFNGKTLYSVERDPSLKINKIRVKDYQSMEKLKRWKWKFIHQFTHYKIYLHYNMMWICRQKSLHYILHKLYIFVFYHNPYTMKGNLILTKSFVCLLQ